MELLEICKQAKAIAPKIGILDTNTKNQALLAVADFLVKEQNSILDANKIDIENGKKNHMPEGLLDRLLLTETRIAQMAEGLRQVAALDVNNLTEASMKQYAAAQGEKARYIYSIQPSILKLKDGR